MRLVSVRSAVRSRLKAGLVSIVVVHLLVAQITGVRFTDETKKWTRSSMVERTTAVRQVMRSIRIGSYSRDSSVGRASGS